MRKIITSCILGCLFLLSIPSAAAHVEIVTSFPERFSNVNPIPTQLWIQFSENLQTLKGKVINSIEVIDSAGQSVNFEESIIVGSKIMTKISDQSAPGSFSVKYRVVGDDGHVIEGHYTFNASPDYVEAVPATTSVPKASSSLNVGGIILVVSLIIFVVGYIIKERKDKK